MLALVEQRKVLVAGPFGNRTQDVMAHCLAAGLIEKGVGHSAPFFITRVFVIAEGLRRREKVIDFFCFLCHSLANVYQS
jgi:hypothetical protein